MKCITGLFVLMLVTATNAQAVSIKSSKLNNEGREIVIQILEALNEAREKAKEEAGPTEKPEKIELNAAELDPAKEKFLTALGLEPRYGIYRFNLAVVMQLQDELENAKKEYDLLLKYATGEFKFIILFNRAVLETQLKNRDKALEYYQQALEIKPKSKEVKTNIELLMQSSQSQGEGESDEENKDENKDGKKGEGDKDSDKNKKDGKPDDGRQKQKKKPKPKSLSEKEIKKILNELKDQEQKIRAKDMKDNFKESPRDKDW